MREREWSYRYRKEQDETGEEGEKKEDETGDFALLPNSAGGGQSHSAAHHRCSFN